jgi:hypothetical protein
MIAFVWSLVTGMTGMIVMKAGDIERAVVSKNRYRLALLDFLMITRGCSWLW